MQGIILRNEGAQWRFDFVLVSLCCLRRKSNTNLARSSLVAPLCLFRVCRAFQRPCTSVVASFVWAFREPNLGWILRLVRESVTPSGLAGVVVWLFSLGLWDGHTQDTACTLGFDSYCV